ncbi:MAG: WecB/TagA/CpsF family glycosyltransferase [Candidatus Omnitrophica bacterium]|nr:WecB/TagA/CpsF family glycosyltransferase [Candidatus Omnitrophota bacterium]
MVTTKQFEFLGLKFHSYTMQEVLDKIEEFISSGKPHMIFTPTAELIVRANDDPELKRKYDKADILTVDSYVVYYAAKLFKKPLIQPVNGARTMLNFLPIAHKKNYRIYLLGAKEEVVCKVVENLHKQYPGINIVGWHNGYFDFNSDEEVVEDIINAKPDILFVAMSSPLKENFVYKNLCKMNVPVSIGVGGTFDIIAGKCKLAPNWISRLGLEWFYRLIQEPKRLWKRYLITNTKFLFLFIRELFKNKGETDGGI